MAGSCQEAAQRIRVNPTGGRVFDVYIGHRIKYTQVNVDIGMAQLFFTAQGGKAMGIFRQPVHGGQLEPHGDGHNNARKIPHPRHLDFRPWIQKGR